MFNGKNLSVVLTDAEVKWKDKFSALPVVIFCLLKHLKKN